MWKGGVRVAVIQEDKILMVKQHHEDRDIWMLPGGTIDRGENSLETVVRELQEETGLTVKPDKLIWFVEQVKPDGEQRFVLFYLADLVSGELKLGTDPERVGEGQVLREVKFFSKEELQNKDIIENIYPEGLREEFWEHVENRRKYYDPHKIRK